MTRNRSLEEIQEDIRTLTRVPSEFIHAKLNELAEEIEELTKPKWIPCSERLPDGYLHCLVTRRNEYEDGFDVDVREDVYIEIEEEWDWQSKFEGLTESIIAWMPKPDPYKRRIK